MGTQVTLPLWAVFILTLLAVWAAVDLILVPSVRWAMRRRANRAIEELNTRLLAPNAPAPEPTHFLGYQLSHDQPDGWPLIDEARRR